MSELVEVFAQTKECEACGKLPTWICASLDQPAEAYCDECYEAHVREAHRGRALAGAARIKRRLDA